MHDGGRFSNGLDYRCPVVVTRWGKAQVLTGKIKGRQRTLHTRVAKPPLTMFVYKPRSDKKCVCKAWIMSFLNCDTHYFCCTLCPSSICPWEYITDNEKSISFLSKKGYIFTDKISGVILTQNIAPILDSLLSYWENAWYSFGGNNKCIQLPLPFFPYLS